MKKYLKFLILFCSFYSYFIKAEFVDNDLSLLHQQDVNFFKKPENLNSREKLLTLHKNMTREEKLKLGKLDDIVKKIQKAKDEELVQSYKDGDKAKRDEHRSFFGHALFGDGNFGDRWREYRAASKAQDEIEQKQEEIRNVDKHVIGESFINKLKFYEIEALQPWQLKHLDLKQIQYFTAEQIKYFTPEQIKYFDVGFFNKEQREALTKEQIRALTADQIEKQLRTLSLFKPEQISWFSPKQVALWTEGEVKSLDKPQIQSLTFEQLKEFNVSYLSKKQRSFLTKNQIQSLDVDQIQEFRDLNDFSADQISWFRIDQINSLTESQILSFTDDQLQKLSIEQLKALKERVPRAYKNYERMRGLSFRMQNKQEQIKAVLNKKINAQMSYLSF